jgi:hypothetical protein
MILMQVKLGYGLEISPHFKPKIRVLLPSLDAVDLSYP